MPDIKNPIINTTKMSIDTIRALGAVLKERADIEAKEILRWREQTPLKNVYLEKEALNDMRQQFGAARKAYTALKKRIDLADGVHHERQHCNQAR